MDEGRIVIVGGGFAGTTVARHLERQLPTNWEIVLISSENSITYTPLLAEVVGASILPGHVVAPIRQILKRTRFQMKTVSDIDFEQKEIHFSSDGTDTVTFDHLVLACGVTANLDALPGMARHSLPLRTPGDALFIRNRLCVRIEEADTQLDPDRRRWLTSFIVIGGGFSGVEVAGEIGDFLHASLRYYPNIREDDCRVVLIHAGDQILPRLPAGLAALALRKMRARGIEIRLGTQVAKVDELGVALSRGERLDGGTVIGTIGSAPIPLIKNLSLPKQHGRVETEADMSVSGHPDVWAAGDCAAIRNARDGQLSPPTAQFARRQAKQLAENMARAIRHQPTRPFSYKALGQLSTIGHQRAVAEVFGIRVSGIVAWLLWRMVYLLMVPTFGRKVRIFFEWTWTCMFPPDISYLSFSRTKNPEL